jgi:2'-5' RNA ligase
MVTPQKFTQKYTIIQLFEDLEDGYEFSSDAWPLHSTLVDVFAIDWSVDEMVSHLNNLLSTHMTAPTVVIGSDSFGPQKQIQVTLLDRTDALVRLHNDVVDLLSEGGLKLNDPQYAREGFLPHATVQKHAKLNIDDKVTFNALSIIDMYPNENPYGRKILKTIKIGS